MKSVKNISLHRKRGSYILEAAVILPVFLVGLLTLAVMIPVIAECEQTAYSSVEELRLEMGKSAFRSNAAALPASAAVRALKGKYVSSYLITGYRYRYQGNGIDDLITISFRSSYHVRSPLGMFGNASFKGRLTGRAFTGSYYNGEPSSEQDFSEDEEYDPVYIFPHWGKCYHNINCTYVKANCCQTYLTDVVRKKYHPCPLCGARNLSTGDTVFCFKESGEAYHTSGCSAVKRYYIEIDRTDAENRGYTPCSKCGG